MSLYLGKSGGGLDKAICKIAKNKNLIYAYKNDLTRIYKKDFKILNQHFSNEFNSFKVFSDINGNKVLTSGIIYFTFCGQNLLLIRIYNHNKMFINFATPSVDSFFKSPFFLCRYLKIKYSIVNIELKTILGFDSFVESTSSDTLDLIMYRTEGSSLKSNRSLLPLPNDILSQNSNISGILNSYNNGDNVILKINELSFNYDNPYELL